MPDAPIRLYCQGDMSLLGNPCVSIVGTRTCSREGIRAAQAIASGLAASGITVVSGLAIGIDKQAHLAALDLPGGTIAVLGAGSDVCYPKENDGLRRSIIQRGLLISEYAPGTLPDPRHFPIRNRIISGLSLGVVVVEAALRSGSLITARLALGRTAPSTPCPAASARNMPKVARSSSVMARSRSFFSDILSDLSAQLKTLLPQPDSAPRPYSLDVPQEPFQSAPAAPPPLRQPDRSTLEGRILTLLAQSPRAIDDVCQSLGCDPGEAGSTLIILEVRGLIRQRPDLRYALT
ncbi:MAG: DNA-processing protein DprA [Bilophila wadsworthia]